jgi:hypothetical protein
MKPEEATVGTLVRVKQAVWEEWCLRHQKDLTDPPEQPITSVPAHPPYEGYVMLAFPFYWWSLDELETLP